MILTDIMVENGVSKEQIYFFDDTKPNIDEAIKNGFKNSYTVNSIVNKNKGVNIYTGSGTELFQQIIDNIINK